MVWVDGGWMCAGIGLVAVLADVGFFLRRVRVSCDWEESMDSMAGWLAGASALSVGACSETPGMINHMFMLEMIDTIGKSRYLHRRKIVKAKLSFSRVRRDQSDSPSNNLHQVV